MKREHVLLTALLVIAVAVGIYNRKTPDTYQPVVYVVQTATPMPSVQQHKKQVETEPYLYAVPLGTFTPDADLTVYEWPDIAAPKVDMLPPGDSVAFTSEYRHDDQLWLCVKWTVDERIASWECTGWVLAEDDGQQFGDLVRDWEYEQAPVLKERA